MNATTNPGRPAVRGRFTCHGDTVAVAVAVPLVWLLYRVLVDEKQIRVHDGYDNVSTSMLLKCTSGTFFCGYLLLKMVVAKPLAVSVGTV